MTESMYILTRRHGDSKVQGCWRKKSNWDAGEDICYRDACESTGILVKKKSTGMLAKEKSIEMLVKVQGFW